MKREVVKQNVGSDLSKKDFKVSFRQMFSDQSIRIKSSSKFTNNLSGFIAFVKWIESKRDKDKSIPVRITMEATGVYYEQLAHYLNEQTDYYVSVVLPNMSKSYFKSLNVKSKTDKIDAQVLGQMGLERDLKEWHPFSEGLRALKQLTRDRSRLMDYKTQINNQLHALNHSYKPSKEVIKRLQRTLKLIATQVKQVEKQIENQVNRDPEMKRKIAAICKMKGLGFTTVAVIIAETNGFQMFTSRAQLISWAGYDVVYNDSGSSIHGKTRISKKGNNHIRRALYFPAIVAKGYDARMGKLYDRVFEKSFISKKAQVAVQRKLLLLIYVLYKNDQDYDAMYLEKKEQEKAEQKAKQIAEQEAQEKMQAA